MVSEIAKKIFPHYANRINNNCCPFCNEKIDENKFKDKLSKDEFNISGLCQKCQDKIFK